MFKNTLLEICLQYLSRSGLHPFQQNYSTLMKSFFIFLIQLYGNVMTVCEVLVNYENIESLDKAVMLPVLLQCTIKMVFLKATMPSFVNLLKQIDSFWPDDQFGQEVKDKIQAIHRKSNKIFKLYVVTSCLAGSSVTIMPAILKFSDLPFSWYAWCDPENVSCYTAMYVIQFVSNAFSVHTALTFEGVFLALITYAYCEIEMIKCGLQRIRTTQDTEDEEEILEEIKMVVEQHNKVLKFIEDLKNMFAVQLLNQYVLSMLAIFYCMLLCSSRGFPPEMKYFIRYSIMLVCMMFQAAIYCFAGTIILEQSLSVSFSAFDTKWWLKTQPRFRKSIVLIIQRSQKPAKLTIGYMSDLNLVTYVSVIRNAISFVALLNSLYALEN